MSRREAIFLHLQSRDEMACPRDLEREIRWPGLGEPSVSSLQQTTFGVNANRVRRVFPFVTQNTT